MMKGKILKLAVGLGRCIGSFGLRFRAWVEFKEWAYLNLEQSKDINLPKDRMVSVFYDRKGSYIKVCFWRWVNLSNGERDLQYIREIVKVSFESTEKALVEV